MKYKIIPADVVKSIIEFLDEIQFDAAEGSTPEDYHKINFCNWIISELMNGVDGVSIDEDEDDIKDRKDRKDIINKYRKDLKEDFPDDMSEREWKKLIQQFDAFVKGWDKEVKRTTHKKRGKKDTLKNFAKELKMDIDLTPEEKFELYYDEYRTRKKEEGISFDKLLNELGISPSKKPKK
tara:strand:- start:315 stop:854 length:540 start_codon:yes stop_codon:yes gene_type:complete